MKSARRAGLLEPDILEALGLARPPVGGGDAAHGELRAWRDGRT